MYNQLMNLERTPLLLEARTKTRHSTNKARDIERSRGGLKKSTVKRLRKGREKLPRSFAQMVRGMGTSMTVPTAGFAMAGPGSFGPVGVGGIMRHS